MICPPATSAGARAHRLAGAALARARACFASPASVAAALAAGTAFTAACGGIQSALDPAGREAERIATITVWMTVFFAIVWAAVIALVLYAPRARETGRRGQTAIIVGGGVVFPIIALTVLLILGLGELPRILAPARAGTLSLDVTGTQWWWRVVYRRPGQPSVELANEIRLPVGTRINTRLASADVVHSFWVPSIAGKMDVIPGRTNLLPMEPTRTGTFRGACAEFCGTAHARMNFMVIVQEPQEFEAWIAHQAQPASPPRTPAAQRGETLFFERGCMTCHAVRGTPAAGQVGPDLTHVGSRLTLAAGTLPTGPDTFRRWIANTDRIKPGVHMPAFAALPADEVAALAAYLAELE